MSIEGLKIGHWQDKKLRTGCTVFIFEESARCISSVQGAASATHETVLLNFPALVDRVDAILWTGGSLKGLNAVSGVQSYLEEKRMGFKTPAGPLPIVPAMAIYDLGIGEVSVPSAENAYDACKGATGKFPFEKFMGAGCGATVGKAWGVHFCSESGIGWSEAFFEEGAFCCFALCNAFGEIRNPDNGEIIAGVKQEANSFLPTYEALISAKGQKPFGNCTFLLLITDVRFNVREQQWLANCLRGCISNVVNPSPTPFDYDVAIVASVGAKTVSTQKALGIVWKLGQRALVRCVENSFMTDPFK